MKRTFLLFVIVFATILNNRAYAQVDSFFSKDDFEKYKEEQFKEFYNFKNESEKTYKEYAEAMRAEYMEFISVLKSIWGEDNVVEDSKTVWVEYGEDLKSRSVVDFENGKIDVEIILDDVEEKDSVIVKERLADAISDILQSRGQTLPYESKVDKRQPVSQTPILEGLVDLSKYDIKEESESKKNIKKIIEPKPKKKTPPAPVVRSKALTVVESGVKKDSAVKTKANEVLENKIKSETTDFAETKTEESEVTVESGADFDTVASTDVLADIETGVTAEFATEISANVSTDVVADVPAETPTDKERADVELGKNVVLPEKMENVATSIVEQSPKTITKIKGNDKEEKTVIKIEMALVCDNLSKSAAVYKDYVEQYSDKFEIEQPLIYAVIEQESCFNPKAKSWVPAYGLMQLVPSSGAYDAYRYVYKSDWIPTQSYLYIPHQNIELGTAYLRILMNQFSKVVNSECRRLCVIASYNTGAGNVSRAFTGNTNIKKAIPIINEYSYQQLYEYLTSKLSTDEARKYVSGVSRRREKYMK